MLRVVRGVRDRPLLGSSSRVGCHRRPIDPPERLLGAFPSSIPWWPLDEPLGMTGGVRGQTGAVPDGEDRGWRGRSGRRPACR